MQKNLFMENIARTDRFMSENNLDGLVLYALDPFRSGNLRYLSNHLPYAGCSFLIIPARASREDYSLLLGVLGDQYRYVAFAKEESWVPYVKGWRLLGQIRNVFKEYSLNSGRIGVVGFKDMPRLFLQFFKEEFPQSFFVDITNPFEQMRMVKSTKEIGFTRRASEIAWTAVDTLKKEAKVGLRENELAAEIGRAVRQSGAEIRNREHTLLRIVSGQKTDLAVRPLASVREIQLGDNILIQICPAWNGYRAEIARTVRVGEPPEERAKFFEKIYKCQRRILSGIKPGVKARELHKMAQATAKELRIADFVCYDFGHGIGLSVSEPPFLDKRDETILVPGMILVIRVGGFIPKEEGGLISDTILVTETGNEVLTAKDHGTSLAE